jgi:phosphoribosylanthranilate isomerase
MVKICGMREPENIAQVLALKPDFIGFIFYPKSKRFVGENFAPEIIRNASKTCKTVGVFVNEDFEQLLHLAKKFKFDFVQLHGSESPEYCQRAQAARLKIIKAFGVSDDFDFEITKKYSDVCDYFLFDTQSAQHGGTGHKFDWQVLEKYQGDNPFFLSGGIGPADAEALKGFFHPKLFALDINSRFETDFALKNVVLLRQFLNTIRTTF